MKELRWETKGKENFSFVSYISTDYKLFIQILFLQDETTLNILARLLFTVSHKCYFLFLCKLFSSKYLYSLPFFLEDRHLQTIPCHPDSKLGSLSVIMKSIYIDHGIFSIYSSVSLCFLLHSLFLINHI